MEQKRLGDIATYINGYPFKPEERGTEGLPIVRIQDLTGNTNNLGFYHGDYPKRIEINDGDVLISWSASLGVYIWNRGKALLNQHIFKVVFDKVSVDKQYFVYAVQHKLKEMESKTHGATMKHIVKKDFDNTMIPFPSLQQQAEIAGILSKVEGIIKARQKELSEFDELIKARFVEMFGDVIRNNKGWPQYVFSDIASSRLGKMLDAKKQTGNYVFPYLANFNVQWFRFELDNLNKMDFNEEEQKAFELKDGDLLMCEGGEIGRCAVWHNEIKPCYFQKALHRIRCNTDLVLPDYLARWFQYNCENGGFSSIEGAKATIAHFPGAKLKKIQIVVPPIELQRVFVQTADQIDKSKTVVKKTLAESQLLFNSLLKKYFG